MILKPEQIQQFIKEPRAEKLLSSARKLSEKYRLHINGDKYKQWLKNRIQSLETERTKEIKEMLARPTTRAIFKDVNNVHGKIFRADGMIRNYNFEGDSKDREVEFRDTLKTVANGSSSKRYMKDTWFNALRLDPMGIDMVEVGALTKEQLESEQDEIGQPVWKHVSTKNIHDYKIVGNKMEYLILTWIEVWGAGDNTKDVTVYRVIDDKKDTLYIKNDQGGVELYPEAEAQRRGKEVQIDNPFGQVPAIQTSQRIIQDDDPEYKASFLEEAMEYADVYLSVSDDHIVCTKIYQNPIPYAYPIDCDKCEGTGEIERKEDPDNLGPYDCGKCKGVGKISPLSDVSKGIDVPFNKNAQSGEITTPPIGAPMAFVQMDHESLIQQRDELTYNGNQIEKAAVGIVGLLERSATIETATGKILDLQPVIDILNMMSANGEEVEKFLTDMTGTLIYGDAYTGSEVHWGRKYHIKTEEQLIEEIKRAKESGANQTLLMELYKELYATRFENNPRAAERAILLLEIEPYPTMSVKEAKELEIANPDMLQLKMNFNDLVEEFEIRNGDITLHNTENPKRITEIRNDLLTILRESQKADSQADILRTFPTSVQDTIIRRLPDEQVQGLLTANPIKPE